MLILETEAKIRRLYFIQNQSIKEITRTLGISRNTVRRVLRKTSIGDGYQRTHQVLPRLGDYTARLEEWLLQENKLPPSQRSTARKMHERLQAQGYTGAYDSVQRFIKQWHFCAGKINTAYVPLYFSPGEAYQFDWSHEIVELGGIVQTVKVAHFRLCFSRLIFVVAYPRETQEMLFDAHDRAFTFFNGIPLRGIYDNMKTAIDTVFIGKKRKFNQRFLQMLNHYLIEPTACTPAAGWEKGQVENQVGNVREWVFVPCLKFSNLDALNEHLVKSCLELSHTRKHPEQKTLSIEEVYSQQERAALRQLIPIFNGYSEHTCKVSSTCLVNFERNRYSVECRYAHHTVDLRVYATRIDVVSESTKIAEHARHFGRDKVIYNPWHYVPLLERKPGALRNGAPFKDWELPLPIQKVREKLMKRTGGDKQCVHILQTIQTHGMEAVVVACELALSDGVISADYILNLLYRLQPTASPSNLSIPDNLKLESEPQADCQRYDNLLTEISYAIH